MTSSLPYSLFSLYLILILSFLITISGIFSEQFAETKAPNAVNKMSHLHFYFHDIFSGKNPTAIIIAGGKKVFGSTMMADDPLTESPEPDSKLVGRAQGIYALASQHDPGLLMVMNFAFLEGEYNGSALSILGRNPFLDTVREMPVVGGSGLFRFARCYALAKTVQYNTETLDAIVEYNVFVMHG